MSILKLSWPGLSTCITDTCSVFAEIVFSFAFPKNHCNGFVVLASGKIDEVYSSRLKCEQPQNCRKQRFCQKYAESARNHANDVSKKQKKTAIF